MDGISTEGAAIDIVEALHKHKIPIDLSEQAFENAMFLIRHNTIPYSPKDLRTRASATEEIVDKVTDDPHF